MNKLIVLLSVLFAAVFMTMAYRPVTVTHPGLYPPKPDNWQAQSQKREGTVLCPPFCDDQQQFGIGKRQE